MKKQAKTKILSCRVTPEQREMIEEKAYSSYRTPSMYLRDCALDKKIVVINGVDELASELRKIGNNLNQLTRAVNSGYAYEVDLRETREEVARIWQSLNSLLGDLLSTVPDDYYYQPQYIDETSTAEKQRIEKILGRRICNEAFYTYCTREEYEREQGISM